MSVADELVSLLKSRRTKFHEGERNARLLDYYREAYPKGRTKGEESQKFKGFNLGPPISALRKDLREAFKSDRSLWKYQKILSISTNPDGGHSLELLPIHPVLRPTARIWFHQCVGAKDDEGEHEPQPIAVLSQPIFFFLPSLNAYVRFLDINHDSVIRSEEALLTAARDSLVSVFSRGESESKVNEETEKYVSNLELVPVRLYLPAGDSFAKTHIRRWFRYKVQVRVGFMPASSITLDQAAELNLIVLGSRNSLPLVSDFQEQNKGTLRLKLTERGISFRDGEREIAMNDKIEPRLGTTLSRVIVTNWKTDSFTHTYLLSNHTRAIQAVANFLVDDSEQNTLLRQVTEKLIVDDRIPDKFQLAFEVPLFDHETNAGAVKLLPELNGEPLIYR